MDFSPGFSVGDDFRIVSVFSAELGSTADTCGASVYEAFWKNFRVVQTVQKTVKIPHAFLDMVVDKCQRVDSALNCGVSAVGAAPLCLC